MNNVSHKRYCIKDGKYFMDMHISTRQHKKMETFYGRMTTGPTDSHDLQRTASCRDDAQIRTAFRGCEEKFDNCPRASKEMPAPRTGSLAGTEHMNRPIWRLAAPPISFSINRFLVSAPLL